MNRQKQAFVLSKIVFKLYYMLKNKIMCMYSLSEYKEYPHILFPLSKPRPILIPFVEGKMLWISSWAFISLI